MNCKKCSGKMVDGKTLLNELITFWDEPFVFAKDNDNRGNTQARIGTAKEVEVWKCKDCGHSFTK